LKKKEGNKKAKEKLVAGEVARCQASQSLQRRYSSVMRKGFVFGAV